MGPAGGKWRECSRKTEHNVIGVKVSGMDEAREQNEGQ